MARSRSFSVQVSGQPSFTITNIPAQHAHMFNDKVRTLVQDTITGLFKFEAFETESFITILLQLKSKEI